MRSWSPALISLATRRSAGAGAAACTRATTRLPGEAGALHRGAHLRRLLGASDRDQSHDHDPVRVRQERGDRPRRQLRARRRGAEGASTRGPQTAGLPVRRHRHLQGSRGRELLAERPAEPAALGVSGSDDRDDRLGAGARRIPLHGPDDRSRASTQVVRPGAVGQREGRQPRAVRSRPPVRSRRRALPGDGRSVRSWTSRCGRRTC